MTYLLDTDTLSLAERGKNRVRERIAAALAAGEVAVSGPTRAQVLRGRADAVLKAADGAAVAQAIDRLRSSEVYLSGFSALRFDASAADRLDRFPADKKFKFPGDHVDLMIACVALAHDATLVTRNVKDFRGVPGLRVENWAD